MENSKANAQETKTELPYNPTISLLGIDPKERKGRIGTESLYVHVQSSIMVEVIQVLTDRRIDKQNVDIHAMEYYSALKRKKILIHTLARINLRDIILYEINNHKRSNTI